MANKCATGKHPHPLTSSGGDRAFMGLSVVLQYGCLMTIVHVTRAARVVNSRSTSIDQLARNRPCASSDTLVRNIQHVVSLRR